jgi:hypothetical protein
VSDFGNHPASYRAAIEPGDYPAAGIAARRLLPLQLPDALRLTTLAAQAAPEHFDRLARRWLSRLIEEREPPLSPLAVVAQLLADVGEGAMVPENLVVPLSRVLAGKPVG